MLIKYIVYSYMENSIKKIISSLHKEIENPTGVIEFNRQHIFEDVKTVIKNQLRSSDIMDMNYHFNVYEKCLKFSRQKDFELAEYWIKQITQSFSELDTHVQEPLKLLYYPMIGFYHYAQKDHQNALDYLTRVIHTVNEFLQDFSELHAEFTLEQTVNIYRIHYATNNLADTLNYGGAILQFAINGTETQGVVEGDISSLKLNDPEIVKSWISYITNSILAKPMYDSNNDSYSKEVIEQVFTPLFGLEDWSQCPIKGYQNAIYSLKHFYANNANEQITEIEKLVSSIYDLPSFLQVHILNLLSKTIQKEFPKYHAKYSATIAEYFSKNLKLRFSLPEQTVLSA